MWFIHNISQARNVSPLIKKSPEIKSYQFATLFPRTFFLAPIWFYTKKSSEKNPLSSENERFTMEKSPFFLGFSFPMIYFLQDFFFLRSYFLRLYRKPPYYFRKKSPRNPKHRTLFPVTFSPSTWENSDFFPKF